MGLRTFRARPPGTQHVAATPCPARPVYPLPPAPPSLGEVCRGLSKTSREAQPPLVGAGASFAMISNFFFCATDLNAACDGPATFR